MTLVGLDNSSTSTSNDLVSMMLSVQSQYPSSIGHRVIVANNNNNNNNNNHCSNAEANSDAASKMQQQQQQKKKMYAQSSPYSSSSSSSSSSGSGSHQPASVARRNARERNRVKQVNNGFATLRQHIPQSLAQALGSNTAGTHGGARAGSKKLSKVETLRMAVEYIRNLQQLLDEHDNDSASSSSSSSSSSSPPPPLRRSSGSSAAPVLDVIKFELKSESGDEQRHYERQMSPVYVPAPCSEASSSPTPSFVSDCSSSLGAAHPTTTTTTTTSHHHHPSSGNYGANFSTTIYPATAADGYDNYEPMSPEEEVTLLDYISSNYMWPQAQ